jgi:hypothetical protein
MDPEHCHELTLRGIGIVVPVTMDGLEVDALKGKLDGELCGPRFSHHKHDHLKKVISYGWISVSKLSEVREYRYKKM